MLGGTMKEPKHWIKIHEATLGHHEMLDNVQDVLADMNIDCYNDIELAKKNQCDLYVIFEKQQ